jgi:hypothetical protein
MARSPELCANPWLCSLLPNIATERRPEAGDQEQGGVHERDAGVESFEGRCTNGQPEDSVLIPVDVTATAAPLISQDRVREQRWELPPPPATVIKQTTNRWSLLSRKSCSTISRQRNKGERPAFSCLRGNEEESARKQAAGWQEAPEGATHAMSAPSNPVKGRSCHGAPADFVRSGRGYVARPRLGNVKGDAQVLDQDLDRRIACFQSRWVPRESITLRRRVRGRRSPDAAA